MFIFLFPLPNRSKNHDLYKKKYWYLILIVIYKYLLDAGWSSPVARQAHNLKVVRFKSHSRTQIKRKLVGFLFFCKEKIHIPEKTFRLKADMQRICFSKNKFALNVSNIEQLKDSADKNTQRSKGKLHFFELFPVWTTQQETIRKLKFQKHLQP